MIRSGLLACVLAAWFANLAFAQSTGAISGRIVDQGGAVLPGVSVTVTHVSTGVKRSTVTNAEGLFGVPALAPGRLPCAPTCRGSRPSNGRISS